MSERAYTVKELDDLRRVCEDRYLFGTSVNDGRGRQSRAYSERDLNHAIEETVRTHMMAGHTAQDLRDADEARETERKKQYNINMTGKTDG